MKEAEDNILKLLGDEQLRKKLGKNGKSEVEMKYTEKNFINKMEQDYLNILSK